MFLDAMQRSVCETNISIILCTGRISKKRASSLLHRTRTDMFIICDSSLKSRLRFPHPLVERVLSMLRGLAARTHTVAQMDDARKEEWIKMSRMDPAMEFRHIIDGIRNGNLLQMPFLFQILNDTPSIETKVEGKSAIEQKPPRSTVKVKRNPTVQSRSESKHMPYMGSTDITLHTLTEATTTSTYTILMDRSESGRIEFSRFCVLADGSFLFLDTTAVDTIQRFDGKDCVNISWPAAGIRTLVPSNSTDHVLLLDTEDRLLEIEWSTGQVTKSHNKHVQWLIGWSQASGLVYRDKSRQVRWTSLPTTLGHISMNPDSRCWLPGTKLVSVTNCVNPVTGHVWEAVEGDHSCLYELVPSKEPDTDSLRGVHKTIRHSVLPLVQDKADENKNNPNLPPITNPDHVPQVKASEFWGSTWTRGLVCDCRGQVLVTDATDPTRLFVYSPWENKCWLLRDLPALVQLYVDDEGRLYGCTSKTIVRIHERAANFAEQTIYARRELACVVDFLSLDARRVIASYACMCFGDPM